MSMCTLYAVNLKRERHNKTLEIPSRDSVFIYRAIIDRYSFTFRQQSTLSQSWYVSGKNSPPRPIKYPSRRSSIQYRFAVCIYTLHLPTSSVSQLILLQSGWAELRGDYGCGGRAGPEWRKKEIISCGLTLLFVFLEGLIGLNVRIPIHIDCHC